MLSERPGITALRDVSSRKIRLGVDEMLAAELTHQLNQPLAATIAYCRACQRLLRAGTEPMETIIDAMDKAVAQAERAGEIIRRTRDFLTSGEMNVVSVTIADLIAQSAQTTVTGNIPLRFSIAADLPKVMVDALQVEQVLVNLLQNAMDAITSDACPNGEVSVSAAMSQPGWVTISVADNGPGMSAEIAERLFSPFTTTKASGMGLGVFIAREIIQAHGGELIMQARPGGGTVFSFTLPVWTDSP